MSFQPGLACKKPGNDVQTEVAASALGTFVAYMAA